VFQKMSIIGNLGRDVDMRFTPQGTAVANFSVATTRKWTGKDGEAHEETTWFKVTAWGKLGEICNEYLAKGRQVYVEGTLTGDERGNPRVYERKDGTFGASFELRADVVKFLGGRQANDAGVAQDESPEDYNQEANSVPF